MSDVREISPPSPTPRDRLRARHDEQLALLNTFLGYDAKVTRARTALETFEADQRAALGDLAAATGADVAAELTGVAVAKVREAVAERRRTPPPRTTAVRER